MRFVHLVLAFLVLPGWAALAAADEPASKEPAKKRQISPQEIDHLVQQLGDDQFNKRTQARKQLEAIGEPALGALKKALESTSDPEIRNAARALIETFEQKHNGVLRVFTGHGDRVNGVAIRADGKRALSASWDNGLRYWDLEKGTLLREMRGTGPLNSVSLSADGKRALTGSVGVMYLWEVDSGQQLRAFGGHPAQVWDVVFSPDGKKALSACSDGVARLWDLESGQQLLTLGAQRGGGLWTVAFTPDGKQAVTGGGQVLLGNGAPGSSLVLWDLANGKEIRQFDGHTKDVRRVAIARDGKRLLSGSFDGSMRLWDMETGKELNRFEGPGHFVEAVAFLADGKKALCSYGPRGVQAIDEADASCSLRLWDLASGKELKQFRGHGGPVLSLAVSADGRFAVSGSADNTMRLWKMPK